MTTTNNSDQNPTVQQLESLLASSLDVIFRISPTGKINFISQSSFHLLGYEPEEMIDRSISDFIPEEKIKRYFEEMTQLFRESHVITFSADMIHKNGNRIPVE
ncbi:MAG: PAS domain-containing protein, partial [Ignavibacteriota bacterium]